MAITFRPKSCAKFNGFYGRLRHGKGNGHLAIIDDYNRTIQLDTIVSVETMKLGIAEFTCGHCGHIFDAPELAPEIYGMFLLRSKNGSLAVLDAIQDKTYEEVVSIIRGKLRKRDMTDDERIDIIQGIYGELACDPDINGAAFVIGMPPKCPACNNQRLASWDFKDPPMTVEITVPAVTHKRWRSLSTAEQKANAQRLISLRL